MSTPKSRNLLYLYLLVFLAFFLTLFDIILNFRGPFFGFLDLFVSYPFADLLIKLDFLLLLLPLLVLYRRWRSEVAKRQRSEESLLSLQKAVETMQIGVTITDRDGKIVYVNEAEAQMHGYGMKDLIGKDARVLGPPEIWKPMSQPILKRFRRETVNVRKDGSIFPVQLMSDVVTNSEGDVIAVVTTCEDITERRKSEETIKHLAFYDSLTGLPNRSLFNDRLNQELTKARRHKESVAVMFVDLDRFKVINDTLGHTYGDHLLQVVSQRFKSLLREGDTVSRLGGDEFILLFADINRKEDVTVIAEKVLGKLSEAYALNETEVYITASIGISMFPENGEDTEVLVKHADTAMYYAKEQGRNNYQFYSSTINFDTVEKLKIQSHLQKAIKRNDLIVHYQPQVDIRSGRVVGAEALVRLRHPDYGLLGPKEFITIAEETGLIVPIGEYMLFTACAQNKAWQETGFSPIRIAINISMHQFNQKDFIELLAGVLSEMELEPKCVELEFTESIFMQNSELTAAKLKELKALGVHCCIDDFGTGYSSLSYLRYLPISKLKLDQSFVSSLTTDSNDRAISKAIISMAHSLNLKVTAEGVETVEQLEFLRSNDCDEAQGFLFSQPLPAKDFVRFLSAEGRG